MSSLTAELEQLWASAAQPPDLREWVSSHVAATSCPTEALLAALQLDQQRRWQTPQPWRAEDYLSLLPELPSGIDWRLELAAGEYSARRDSANPLTEEEIQSRFPDLAEKIKRVNPTDPPRPPTTIVRRADTWLGKSGRYRLDKILGRGAFGVVHLAYDEELKRQVAIKVPHPESLNADYGPERYLQEAQAVAALSHPNIVPVYDVGRTDEGLVYIVAQFIPGETLEDQLKKRRPDLRANVELLATVATALHFAHSTRRLIHRDVKPANILIEEGTGKPFVADFGVAVHEDQWLRERSLAGSPGYMSPEQARAEEHRLDGRSDVFSLGVILYEMLTGTRPFRGNSREAVLEAVLSGTPAPPRSLEPSSPTELERICLRALSKLKNDRHASAAEFAADLRAWLQPPNTPQTPRPPAKLEPRGLRSFEEQDKDFFLDLLPGPRNRDQLPESIAFWKRKIEEPIAEQTFSVGVIYGPSGCGKSSLVKAGLLPRLSPDLVTIFLEATPDTTEHQLCNTLRRRLPQLPATGGLAELFAEIRHKPGPKVAIFLDQFEQWLLANPIDSRQPLVLALGQCHGGRLQTVLMIREDFFGGVTQLMKQVQISLVQQHNFAMVDLFDIAHATRVLGKLGRAYERLPEPPAELTTPQQAFLEQSVRQLAVKEAVIPVRLALFAQMVRSKPWEPATLEQMGGLAGVGVVFLEETFTRDARYRQHQQAVRNLLKALLPKVTADIKGSMKSASELRTESGYENRGHDFQELLRILDSELRLITPTVAETEDNAADSPPPSPHPDLPPAHSLFSTSHSPSYQLTHDYLVPSIREWLRLNQTAEERTLEDRTDRWSEKRESRQLPSLGEWTRIHLRTDRSRWTAQQREMMRAAGWGHGIRGSIALLLVLAAVFLNSWIRRQAEIGRANDLASVIPTQKTSDLAAGLVPLQQLREYALSPLQNLYAESAQDSEARLHLAIARLQLGDDDADLLPTIQNRSLECRPEQLLPLTKLLQPWAKQLGPKLRAVLQDDRQPAILRLHSACLLAAWEPGEGEGEDMVWSNPETTVFTAEQLAATNPLLIGAYQEVLRPQAARLKWPLAKLFADPKQSEVSRTIITGLLADYAKDDVQILTDLIVGADPAADKVLFPLLHPHRGEAIKQFAAILDRQLSPAWSDPPQHPTWTTPGATVKAQIEVAHGVLADSYAFCLDMPLPELLSLVETLRGSGYRPTRLRPVVGSDPGIPRMSAVWVRDGGKFCVKAGQKQRDLPHPDENAIREGLLLADVALVPGSGQHAGWLTLWEEPVAPGEERRCVANASDEQLSQVQTKLKEENFGSQSTIHVHNAADGERRYSGVFSNVGPGSDLLPAWPGYERIDSPQRDISTGAESPESPRIPAVWTINFLTWPPAGPMLPPKDWDAVVASEPIAKLTTEELFFHWVAPSLPENLKSLSHFAVIAHTRMIFPDTPVVLSLVYDDGIRVRIDDEIVFENWSLNHAVPRGIRLDGVAGEHTVSVEYFQIDGGYALGCHAFSVEQTQLDRNPDLPNTLARKVVAQSLATAAGNRLNLPPSGPFAGVWFAEPNLESRLLRASAAAEVVRQAESLLAENWRPISASLDANSSSAVLLLQRPLISAAEREALAVERAAAATALLRLDAADRVWSLLQDSPDPTTRSLILQRLPRYGIDGAVLLKQLASEVDAGRRRTLILGVAELVRADLIPETLRANLVEDFAKLYADDPDPGVHSAAEWALRQLQAEPRIAEIRSAFATGTPVGDRRWYITKTRGATEDSSGLSMAIVDGRIDFLMGSPLGEAGRNGGAKGRPNDELLHRRRIGRTYAIGMHEVTVAQFRAFRRTHDFSRAYSTQDDAPANSITWYEAAAFCNWLSEQEGLPPEQWCYKPDQPFSNGMKLKANCLDLEGYRLPTEAEWEFAARGGTMSPRFFGDGRGLLGDYAWFLGNSNQAGMLPVGSLRPNQSGLFELYGNAAEWCQDEARYLPAYRERLGDDPQTGSGAEVVDTMSRSLRGGSFNDVENIMRSATRGADQPDDREIFNAIRVSRTYRVNP